MTGFKCRFIEAQKNEWGMMDRRAEQVKELTGLTGNEPTMIENT